MKEIEKEILKHRRHIHKNPEISFDEFQTTSYIFDVLSSYKVFDIERLSKTGLVATIRAKNKIRKTIAFRADIDALEIEENTNLSFKSKNKGIMHSCGHDAHSAILLGLAKLLYNNHESLKGDIKLIFQAGEEISPGGAKELVKLGVMDNVDKIFALHLLPGKKTKTISIKRGFASANKDSFDIFVNGKGGHSSSPQNCIDPILVASSIVLNLQSLISRNISPFDNAVVSITSLNSGTPYAAIPEMAHLTGSIRTFDNKTRKIIKEKIVKMIENTALAYSASAIIEFKDDDYLAIYNDENLCKDLENIVEEKIGKEFLIRDTLPMSFSEDFSEYLKKARGCMVWLGVGEYVPKLHSPSFNPDENSFIVGTKFFYEIVKKYSF